MLAEFCIGENLPTELESIFVLFALVATLEEKTKHCIHENTCIYIHTLHSNTGHSVLVFYYATGHLVFQPFSLVGRSISL